MDDPARCLEELEEKLYHANQITPAEKLHFVAFICTAALPYGLIYKENLDAVPSVQDVYHALEKYHKTHHIALQLIKYALDIAGCPPHQISLLHGESVQERMNESGGHHFSKDLVCELKFRELLIDIGNDLTGDEKKSLINFGRPLLKKGADYTPSLLVHFLLLLQNDLIGVRKVEDLFEWLSVLGRQHTIEKVGKYCSDHDIPVQARQTDIPHSATCGEQHPISRGDAPTLSSTAPSAFLPPQQSTLEDSQHAEEGSLPPGRSSPYDLDHPDVHPFLVSQEATSGQGNSALLVDSTMVPMQEEVIRDDHNNTEDIFTLDQNVVEDSGTGRQQKILVASGHQDESETVEAEGPTDGDYCGSAPRDIDMSHATDLVTASGSEKDSNPCERAPLLDHNTKPQTYGPPYQTHEDPGRKFRKKAMRCCCIAIGYVLWLLGIFIFLGLILSYVVEAPPRSGKVYLQKGDNVLTREGGFTPYYFSKVAFFQSSKMEGEQSTVVFHRSPCTDLILYNETINTNTSTWNISLEESHKFKLGFEGYFPKGSEVEFHINVTGIGEFSDCSAALYIFPNPDTYEEFLDSEGQAGFEEYRQYCIPITQSASYHKPYVFRPSEDSYYFAAVYVPTGAEGGRSLSYRITGTLMYYGNTSHSFTCHLEHKKTKCSTTDINLGSDICILATAIDDDVVWVGYSTKRGAFWYVGICGLSVFAVVLKLSLLLLCLYFYRRRWR